MSWLRALIVPLLLIAHTSFAQDAADARQDTLETREVSIGGDLLEREIVDGEQVRRLTGNVTLRQEATRLWADRATQYPGRRDILFTGDVLVVERGDSLRADTVLYNERTKTGRARGRVRLSDGDVLVFAPSGLYFTREKRAQFTEGVTLIDSTATLRSREGEYWSDEKRAEFYGDVTLDEIRTHLEADSVSYHREDDVSIARGRVFIDRIGDEEDADTDSLSRTMLFGDYAFNDEKASFSRIRGRALMVQLRTDTTEAEVDSLLISAALLEVSTTDSLRRLVAVDSVNIWQSDLAAIADSVVYDRITTDDDSLYEEVRMFKGPLAWFETSQVSGDTLLIEARGGSVDTLYMRNDAFVSRMDTTLQRVQQLKGLHLTTTFRDDSLRTLSIGPRAEAINFLTGDEDEPAGAVRMSADRIVFHFDENEPSRMSAIRDPESTYYSENLLPDDFQLDGFYWAPERRPTREGLLDHAILRVRREAVAHTRREAVDEIQLKTAEPKSTGDPTSDPAEEYPSEFAADPNASAEK